MAPWIRTQPAQNTVDRYNVSPVDSEIDVHRSHSNVSRVSDAPRADLVSKHNGTSVEHQTYPSDQTRTSGGYSHPFQSELRMQKTDEGITHTMVAEIPTGRTENSNIPPSLQVKRPGVDHTRVNSSANTSKFTEEFEDTQPADNHGAFLSPYQRRPAVRAKSTTTQRRLQNDIHYKPDVEPRRDKLEDSRSQQTQQPPLPSRPDMKATGYPVQNVDDDLAYLDPYEIEGAARPKPKSPMVKYAAPHVADVSPYLDPHAAEVATRFTPATMTTVQYNNREILQSRCPLGNLSEEDKDIIERIKKAYVRSHPRVDSVEKVEIKWTELNANKAKAILMVESEPTGMRSAPAETKGEALENLAEQLGVAVTNDRKQKLGFWRRALCLCK